MQRTTIGDVTTLWDDLPGRFQARLIFGVGAGDATFTTIEAPHIVEHLAMTGLGKSHADFNASVNPHLTFFEAIGDVAEVTKFLMHVCGALRSLPMNRLEHEQRVVGIEDGSPLPPDLAWAAFARIGFQGAGLGWTDGPLDVHASAEQIQAFVDEHFVAGNAVLVLSQTPPEGLRLDLPPGQRARRAAPSRFGPPMPGRVVGAPIPVLSFELPETDASLLLCAILRERIEDAVRHANGHAYEVRGSSTALDGLNMVVAISADAPEEHHRAVATVMWSELKRLASEGPDADEVDREVRRAESVMSDVTTTFDHMSDSACAFLVRGELISPAANLAATTAHGREGVHRDAQRALATALMALPESFSGLDDLPDRTTDTEALPSFPGRRFPRRTISFAPRKFFVELNDEGLAMPAAAGRWSDLVGVGVGDEFREVVFRNGTSNLVHQSFVKKADELFAEIDRRGAGVAYPLTLKQLEDHARAN